MTLLLLVFDTVSSIISDVTLSVDGVQHLSEEKEANTSHFGYHLKYSTLTFEMIKIEMSFLWSEQQQIQIPYMQKAGDT